MEEPGEEATATVTLQVLCEFFFNHPVHHHHDHDDSDDDHDDDRDDDHDDSNDVDGDPNNDSFVDPDPDLLSDPPEISVAKSMLQFHPKVRQACRFQNG